MTFFPKITPASSRRLLTLSNLLAGAGALPMPPTPTPATAHAQPAPVALTPPSAHQTTIQERYAMLVQHFSEGNKARFARRVSISYYLVDGVLGGRQTSPSVEHIQQILRALPQVSTTWLVMDQGPMLLASDGPSPLTE